MKNLALRTLLGLAVITTCFSTNAAETQVFGPQKVTASSKTFKASFSSSSTLGKLTVVNGDGEDLTPQSCKNLPKLQKLLCELNNAKKALKVALDRPKSIDIQINNVVFVSKVNLPPTKGEITIVVPLAAQNNIQIKVTGLPWTKATVGVKATGATNQLPIPRFSATPESGVAPETVVFNGVMSSDPDGSIQDYEWDFGDGSFSAGSIVTHLYQNSGVYQAKLTVTDTQGGKAFITKTINMSVNQSPLANFSFMVEGSRVSFNGNLSTDSDGSIVEYKWDYGDNQSGEGIQSTHEYSGPGSYQVKLTIKDNKGAVQALTKTVSVIVASPPTARIAAKSPTQGFAPLMVFLDGSGSTDPSQSPLTYQWDMGDGTQITGQQKVTHEYKNIGSYTVRLVVTNSSSQSNTKEITIQVSPLVLPPAPETIAPPLAENQVTNLGESAQFLFTGSDPIQKNVVVEEMDLTRLSVISGKVFDESGNALAGVKVRVLDGNTYGYTLSRADGRYDLAVNGGGEFTIHFERNGYLSAQRKTDTKALNYSSTNEVYLVGRDVKVTKVNLSSSEYQIAQGSLVADSSGERTATIIIPNNTTAKLILDSGAEVSVDSLSLRATEYTVGDNGPKRMPAELPLTSGYTYAVDLSADEAVAMGAEHIKFNKPVPVYVDNFLDFPVGTIVPFGIYSFSKGLWEPQPNGIVLKVLSEENGVASISVNELNQVASASVLQKLGITTDELKKIASLYEPEKTLWRVQADHFSPGDMNFIRQNGLSIAGDGEGASGPGSSKPGSCPVKGSIIDTSTQTLGEIVPLQGIDQSLIYTTTRVPGRKAEKTLWIPVADAPLGATLKVEVAGRVITEDLSDTGQLKQFVWDGKDSFGREVQSATQAKISLTYKYPSRYVAPLSDSPQFGRFGGGVPLNVSSRTAWTGNSTQTKIIGTRLAYSGLGGWGISGHHFYDVTNRILYFSNGDKVDTAPESGQDFKALINTFSGSDDAGFEGDSSSYKNAKFNKPASLLVADDDSLYVIDSGNFRIRHISKNGTISTIAGTGVAGFSGDGGNANAAQINVNEN